MSSFKFDEKTIMSQCDPFTDAGAGFLNASAEAKRRAECERSEEAVPAAVAPVGDAKLSERTPAEPALTDVAAGDNEYLTSAPVQTQIEPASSEESYTGADNNRAPAESNGAKQCLTISAVTEFAGLPTDVPIEEVSSTRGTRGRPFPKGRSGNPKGRPRGSRNKATVLLENLFEGNAEALGKRALSAALSGDTKMMNFVLSRLIPATREATVAIDVPALDSPTACRIAKAKLAEAAANGTISSAEAARQISNVEAVERSFRGLDFERRFDEQMADVQMSRLLAKYPYSGNVEIAVRRYIAFCSELDTLELTQRQYERLWRMYHDTLTNEVREIVDRMDEDA